MIPYRVRFRSWLPRLSGHDCITIRRTIYTRHAFITAHTLAHEYKHVEQWATYGLVGFLVRYVREQWTHGYRGNRLEREAQIYAALNESRFQDRVA